MKHPVTSLIQRCISVDTLRVIWSATVYLLLPNSAPYSAPYSVYINARFCRLIYRPECDQLSSEICVLYRESIYLTEVNLALLPRDIRLTGCGIAMDRFSFRCVARALVGSTGEGMTAKTSAILNNNVKGIAHSRVNKSGR
jgi:hypothetical protein